MIRHLAIILSVGLGLGACISTSGTKPADMTAEGHLQACQKHEQRAEAAEQRAQQVDRTEGSENPYRELYVAKLERDVATQHGQAARAVDPNAPRCP